MATKPDYITEVRIYSTVASGKKLAAGSFTVGDAIAINFSVFEGKNGPRIVLPSSINPKFDSSRPADDKNKKYYDEVRTISAETRSELEAYLLEQVTAGPNGQTPSRVTQNTSPFPF